MFALLMKSEIALIAALSFALPLGHAQSTAELCAEAQRREALYHQGLLTCADVLEAQAAVLRAMIAGGEGDTMARTQELKANYNEQVRLAKLTNNKAKELEARQRLRQVNKPSQAGGELKDVDLLAEWVAHCRAQYQAGLGTALRLLQAEIKLKEAFYQEGLVSQFDVLETQAAWLRAMVERQKAGVEAADGSYKAELIENYHNQLRLAEAAGNAEKASEIQALLQAL